MKPGRHGPALAIAAAWALSRLAAWAVGVRFDMRPLGTFFQYLDPEWLRHRLIESLIAQHAQPPAFNLFLGLVLKAFAGHEAIAFHAAFAGLGLATALVGHRLLVRLGLGPWPAAGLAIAFLVSPAALLYEHWLFYALPIAALLLSSAWAIGRFVESLRLRDGVLAFGLLALVCLTRSLYHLGWLLLAVAAVGALVAHRPGGWRVTALAAWAPVLLVVALYAKNFALFHTFSASSWGGMGLAHASIAQLYGPDRRALHAEGRISRQGLYLPFRSLDEYPSDLTATAPTGVPALDRPYKAGGAVNFNHAAYVAISGRYVHDAIASIRARPASYAKGVVKNVLTSLRPATDNEFLSPNAEALAPYLGAVNRLVLWRAGEPGAGPGLRAKLAAVSWLYALAFPALWAWGLWAGLRALGAGPARRPYAAVLLFMVGTIAWTTLVGVLAESGENNRFRFDVDWFYMAIAGGAIAAVAERRRRGGEPRVSGSPSSTPTSRVG